MDAFYAVLMTLNISCAVLVLLSRRQKKQPFLLSLALLNFITCLYHYYSWQLHSAKDLSAAIYYSRMHVATAITALPMMVYTFGHWCRYRYTQVVFYLLSGLAVLLLFLNAWFALPLRYSATVDLLQLQSFWGQPISLLQGELNPLFVIVHALFALCSLFLGYFTYRFYQQSQSVLSVSLLLCLLMQVVVSYTGYMIDSFRWPMFYIGGLPLTLISVISVMLLTSSLKVKDQHLSQQRKQRRQLEQAMTKLAKSISTADSQNFYQEMMKTLYDFSKADFILIGLVEETMPRQVNTLVALKAGALIPNFSYPLAQTPCQQVFAGELCQFPEGVADSFPNDKMLGEEQIQAYIGVPLVDENKLSIGLLALLYQRPFSGSEALKNAITVFAARAGAEIRRSNLQQRLQKMAYVDYLSGLPNRAKLFEVINDSFEHAQHDNKKVAFLLLGLDHFGDINRQYGYEVGDQVIRQLGQRLSHYVSRDIFIARNSSDEFAVLIFNLQQVQCALEVHWHALNSIIQQAFYVGKRQISLACSMGAVVFPEQVKTPFEVISSAEYALLRAKQQGRNQYSLFDPSLLEFLDWKKRIEADLAEALQRGEQLALVFQPKVTVSGEVIGAEALLRWQHPSQGFISPADFIPVAEECGLIHQLGLWVIEQVCQQLQQWQQAQVAVCRISINVTASQFNETDFIQSLLTVLQDYQLPTQLFEIELTESSLLTDIDKTITHLNQLRALGLSIALDDFGTGYSSLSYLHDLPLDVLKIDKSFVDNLQQVRSAELVKSIISISQHMHLKTVAEGTETLEQVQLLADMGCDYYQGYYFSRPLSADDFAQFYQASLLSKRCLD